MTSLPCGGGNLPTKADYVNMMNQISKIPSDLESMLVDAQSQLEAQKTEALDQIEELKRQAREAEGDARAQLDAEIEKLESMDIGLEIQKEIEDQIKEITDTIEGVGDLLAPWWQKGQVRDWEKEAEDAFTELIQDYHIFIPMKIMELISAIIPVTFTVPILGLSIDVLKISTAEEQERLKAQISGDTEGFRASLQQLKDDFESGKLEQDAYDSAMDTLQETKNQIVDTFYSLVPAEYQYFNGEFGVECGEWKAKLTWSYIKNEIMAFVTGSLFELFDKLIGKFKAIWDPLGLPSLPIPLDFDIAAWIRAQVEAAKVKAEREIKRIEDQAEQLQSDIENFDMDAEITKIKDDMLSQITDLALPFPAPFNIALKDVFGGDIDKKTICIEDEIHQLTTAARDWFENAKKGLLFDWVKIVKKFFNAIGLGAIFDFIDLTLCDVLGMIGVPTSFDITLPELPSIDVAISV